MSTASIPKENSDSINGIFRSLSHFKSQFSRYATCKGFIAAITTLCCGMYLLILLDYGGVATDTLRWMSSIGVYVASLTMGWLAGWKRIFRHSSNVQLADELEKLHPHFGERLSSSVELHIAGNMQSPGSSLFVQTVQRQAYRELSRVDLKGLVPWQSLRRWIGVLGILVVTILVLCCIPRLQFTNRLARAMLPFVDIPAPTTWSLRVLSPNASDFIVPSDQSLDFRLLATSLQKNEPLPKQAILEFRESIRESSDASTVRMFPLRKENYEENIYTTMAPIGDKPMSYRFAFGDSKTNWREITPVQRPRVNRFHWTIDFPSYTLLQKEQRTSDTGDIQVLRECRLVLTMAINQALHAGSLVFENLDDGNQQIFPLQRQPSSLAKDLDSDGVEFWQCELNAKQSGRFQVKLESKNQFLDAPIKNTFNPWYKLEVTSDPPAVVEWVATEATPWAEPSRSRDFWMVQPDDWIALVCNVKDNLPILSIASEISINDQPWVDFPLQQTSSSDSIEITDGIYQSRTSLGWDVASSIVSEGDMVALRLKVMDRAESTSYSTPLQFGIASTGFEKDRYKTLEKRAELVSLLEKLKLNLNSNQEDFLTTVAQVQSNGVHAEDTAKSLSKIRDWTESVSSITGEIQIAIQTLMPLLDQCIDQNDLELVARAIARIEKERLSALRFRSDQQLFLDRQRLTATLPEWTNAEHRENCEQMATQWKSASRDADRLFEIYRSFVSLELQTALTKDMTNLLAHQRKQLATPPNKDLASLIRSQVVAERYWKLANDLAIRIAPSVRKEFAKRIPEWQKWMENSRQEIRDLCIKDGDLNARALLLDRIGRDVADLEGQRWIYNYDGEILWKADELRRVLMLQSGSLASQFEALLKLQPRLHELTADHGLSSQELAIKYRFLIRNAESITDSIQQLTERRDIHQLRKHQDPMFGFDMGLAWRAWNAVFVQWKSETTENRAALAKDLTTIYGAYRTLEAAHEMEEAKLAISSLQSPERYDYQTFDGQLQHHRQWDSVASRMDIAMVWMRNARIPVEIPEGYNAIRNSNPFTKAQQLFSLRRDPQNKEIISAARELDSLLGLWNSTDQMAMPHLEKARRTLSQFAPSVADLAKKAADKTRQLQQQTSVLQTPDATAKRNDVQREIREQQNNVNEHVKILQDALIEQAAKQNLLQQSQRELAKDSDRALTLLEEVTERMNEALADAIDAIDTPQADTPQTESSRKPNETSDSVQENATKHALKEQQAAIAAFDSISKHFESNSPEDRSGQPSKLLSPEMNELSKQPMVHSSENNADEYQRAEALEKQLQEDSESILKQLEDELRKNSLMQGELSSISKSQTSSAVSELQRAAGTEQQLKMRIENEDAELFEAKKAKSDKLHALVDLAERTATRTLERALQMSQRADLLENLGSIQSVNERLKTAIDDARQVHERTPAADHDEAIAKLASRLDEVLNDTRSALKTSERSISRPIEKNDQKRINKVNEARNAQNSIRDELTHQVKQITNQWRESGKRAESRVKQLKKEVESIENQRDKWFTSQKANLAQEDVQDDLRRWTSQLDQAIAKLKNASLSESIFDEFSKRADDRFKHIVQRERASLNQPNPYAALASEQLANANLWLDDLGQLARELAENPIGTIPPAPPESTLAQSASTQSELRKDLARIAEDLDRSARHEQRLNNDLGSSQLTEQSSKIRETENGIVKEAGDSLSQTSRETKRAESDQSKPDAKGNITTRLKRPSAAKPIEQLRQAMDALNAHANQLAALNPDPPVAGPGAAKQAQPSLTSQKPEGSLPLTSPASPSTNGSPNSSPPSPSNSMAQNPMKGNASASGGVQQKATEMARMLDQLDRDIYAQQSPTETGDSKQNGEGDVSRSEPNSASNKVRNGKGNMSSARQSAIESSAQQLASEMNQSRMEQKNRNPGGQTYLRNQRGAQSGGEGAKGPNPLERAEDYFLPNSQTSNDREWGKLRTQRAIDVKEGTRESFDPEFDQAIRAYYQAVGNSASGK